MLVWGRRAHFIEKRSIVEIEGVEYNLSKKVGSEWSGNRIELERDYAGETKLNAFMSVKNTAKRFLRRLRALSYSIFGNFRRSAWFEDIIPVSMRREGEAAAGASMGDVRRQYGQEYEPPCCEGEVIFVSHGYWEQHHHRPYSGPDYETHVPSALSTSPSISRLEDDRACIATQVERYG